MATFKTITLLLVFISFSFLPLAVFSGTLRKIFLPSPGPETIVFDSSGRGPYTGVNDGRILIYNRSTRAFDNFAVTAPNRPQTCDGKVTPVSASTCGRTLGLAFDKATNQLYAADASLGLFVIGPSGGQGTLLANSANGTNFSLTDGLDVDQTTGNVYFTDASTTGGINEAPQLISSNDSTGRLLKYDPKTNEVTSLLSGLAVPGALAVSQDGSYILFTEYTKKRIQKYWLRGPKANTTEIILKNITGNPGGVKVTCAGEFWITVIVTPQVLLRGIRINGLGRILETLTFSPQFAATLFTDIQEYEDALLLGSFDASYLGVYRR